jgi:hypothetical protein
MKANSYFILHSQTSEQENAIIAFAKALNMEFIKTIEKPYNPDYVAKIQKSRGEIAGGVGKTISLDDLEDL